MLRRVRVALLIGLLAGCAAALLQRAQAAELYVGGGISGPLYALESSAQDLALQARRPEAYLQVSDPSQVPSTRDPRDLIRIVAIDERTIAELGAYGGGYPRSYHARLIDRLLAAPPRVIGFDIGFFEPTADDAELAAAMERAQQARTRVVLAAIGLLQRGEPIARSDSGELQFGSGLVPPALLAERADIGLSNVLPDERGTIRGIPLLSRLVDQERPTFGLALVAAYLRRPRPIDARPAPDTVEVAGRRIPVDSSTSLRINYFGPPSEPYSPTGTFPVVSFVDVLNGRVDAEAWRDRIVLIGASGAAGLADDYWTPLSMDGRKMSGVEIHANVAATLFSTQFLRDAAAPLQVGLIVATAVLVALLAATLGALAASTATVVVLVGVAALSVWALYALGLQLPLASPLLGGSAAFSGVVAWRVSVEQRQARALVRALASVVPPSVAQQIAREPNRVRLGGERRVISLLFTDLKGFTAFSETIEPELLARIMAEYLDAMSRVVFELGGTLDKFVGDAVMAFWNAPLDDPQHARHACDAALAMQAALAELNAGWQRAGLPAQRMRIGIHSGPASVGNMGTPRRFAYTALGDSVNLAARLEPLNDEYGTSICVSGDTVAAAGEGLVFRFLDRVVVKGKSTPVATFELLGRADDAQLAQRSAPLLAAFSAGVTLYQQREFDAAAEHFRLAARAAGNGLDPPSQVYLARCAELAIDPPAPDWDGVYVMRHK
jgi:adenylate cyclase